MPNRHRPNSASFCSLFPRWERLVDVPHLRHRFDVHSRLEECVTRGLLGGEAGSCCFSHLGWVLQPFPSRGCGPTYEFVPLRFRTEKVDCEGREERPTCAPAACSCVRLLKMEPRPGGSWNQQAGGKSQVWKVGGFLGGHGECWKILGFQRSVR